MPIPIRRTAVEDEIVPRHLNGRRSFLRERDGTANPHFTPRRPSPLTSRPFSSAIDDDIELSPHVPVPLHPTHGLASVPEKPRRTPRSPYGMLDATESGYLSHYGSGSESESRRWDAAKSAATSQDSHENSNSTASHSSQGQQDRKVISRQRSTSIDSLTPPIQAPLPNRGPRLHKPSSFADLRSRAYTIMSGSQSTSSSSSSLHLPLPSRRETGSLVPSDDIGSRSRLEEPKRAGRPRKDSIAKLVLNVFRPKSKRSQSLSIEVTTTTSVTRVEQTSFRRYE